jgi:DNA mismatch endonuclease (patch repair protein)
MDRITADQRSANMGAIKSTGTGPEMIVRRLVHAMGYRYRLHRADLPGKPDLVFGPKRKAIFVHGCYWHGHGCRVGGKGAKSNQQYWGPKISGNRARDQRTAVALRNEGWKILVIWECEIRSGKGLKTRVRNFLGRGKRT